VTLRYLSVCSGIEAATVAWHGLGWQPVAFSEIEPFPSAVLAHHYPTVSNLGDMTKFQEWPDADVDVLVGGPPCQSFSIAGLRKGLDDPRGSLMLTFGAIAKRYRPKWVVFENVPGLLSSNEGRDFGTFLGMLGELGYGFAYRILDARFFGVAQRRRRVFVVGFFGNWRRAAAVLFERYSFQRSSEAVQGIRHAASARSDARTYSVPRIGSLVPDSVASCITRNTGSGGETQNPAYVLDAGKLRELTPVECERLQGFPDGYTDIPWRKKPEAPDGPRYKALGNSMAVPCMAWIGKRIAEVDRGD